MKLAFNGQGRYPDFEKGYALYLRRSRGGVQMDKAMYRRVVRKYCKMLANRLCEDSMVDFPGSLGSISAAIFTRRPQYRGNKFVGFGKIDWQSGLYDGSLKAFGVAYLPRHDKNQNLRAFGFVANGRLFKRMKELYNEQKIVPIEFSNEMI